MRAVEQLLIGGEHRPLGLGTASERHRREGLRQQVDLALLAARHADRRAVVAERARVAVAAERVLVERAQQRIGQRAVMGDGLVVAEMEHDRLERAQRENQEEADEHALAAPLDAHRGKGVVPVAGADAAKPMRAELLGIGKRAHAVQVQVFADAAALGPLIALVFALAQRLGGEVGHLRLEN